ncbi:MAG: ABC transporter ATP-binding protein [Deltaproteobacteria bacterium]|nr:ABC transporter ATP-binding protein [Deltaproteobacteria bacterium]MBI3293553.1 ABC transporter ATP-binding protein [Deltaproteobacteria bacterium]
MKKAIELDRVSKKFCRSLRRSLYYGVEDIVREMLGIKRPERLRPNEHWCLENISFDLFAGDCLALVGENGAGKSTLLRLINGLFPPDTGRIRGYGSVRAVTELGTGFKEILTGRENIYINGAILGMSPSRVKSQFDSIIEFAELTDYVDVPLIAYSTGMKMRLGFAVAIHSGTEVLLLDEVLAYVDERFQAKGCEKIRRACAAGMTAILVGHDRNQFTRTANKAAVLVRGKLTYFGSYLEGVDRVLSNPMTSAESQSWGPTQRRMTTPSELIQ